MEQTTTRCAYRVLGFDGSFKVDIGVDDKKNRICRFCGKSMPEVKFRKKAHALSESIGNKYIINNEECDCCNEKFSVIEQDFYNRHAAFLALHNIKGKNGSRKVKTETVDIFDLNGIVTLEPHNCDLNSIKYDEKGIGSIDFSLPMKYHPHKPQNVYKCLVKYALSIIETSDVPKFPQTITWITTNNATINKLPKVLLYSTKFHSHPRCATFIRNESNDKFPFAFSIVEFANIGYFFILPLGNNEPISGYMQQNLIGMYLQFSNGAPFSLIDLSNTHKIIRKENFTFGNLNKKDMIILPNPISPEDIQKFIAVR